MVEVKHSGKSMEQRVAVTTIHHSGSAKQHGSGHPGEGDLDGNKRGTV
jgi:hypothetical protein